jgi:hypothetical protein
MEPDRGLARRTRPSRRADIFIPFEGLREADTAPKLRIPRESQASIEPHSLSWWARSPSEIKRPCLRDVTLQLLPPIPPSQPCIEPLGRLELDRRGSAWLRGGGFLSKTKTEEAQPPDRASSVPSLRTIALLCCGSLIVFHSYSRLDFPGSSLSFRISRATTPLAELTEC